MRSSETALLERLKDVVEVMKESGIPVIANGDCFGVQDRERIQEITGKKMSYLVTALRLTASDHRCHGDYDCPRSRTKCQLFST